MVCSKVSQNHKTTICYIFRELKKTDWGCQKWKSRLKSAASLSKICSGTINRTERKLYLNITSLNTGNAIEEPKEDYFGEIIQPDDLLNMFGNTESDGEADCNHTSEWFKSGDDKGCR